MTDAIDPELNELMGRLAAGDRSAFAPVFQRLHGPIERLCRNLLQNEADAADAAQEAMQKIFERASDYDVGRPAMPWALAIAGWECRTIVRRRTRRRETPDEAAPEAASGDEEHALIQRDLTAAALHALGDLSDTDREVLLATFWDEAASVSGAALRKRRERALDRLRRAFRRVYGLD